MNPISDARPLTRRVLNEYEQSVVDDILNAAMEWKADRMSIYHAADVGGERPEWMRFLALASTDRTDPRYQALRELLDALIVAQGLLITPTGHVERKSDRRAPHLSLIR